MTATQTRPFPTPVKGNAGEVFAVFLKLGLTSFGGPVAHLGYFRDELVTRRQWLKDADYADLVALCQFLPGPASSQVGFALGLMRAGWAGAFAAFAGFTFPSVFILFAFALGATAVSGPIGSGALHGLKIVAVAIVAQAVWGMACTLCPDRTRATIATGAIGILALFSGAAGMVAAILFGAIAGRLFCHSTARYAPAPRLPVSRTAAMFCLFLAVGLLALLPILAPLSPSLSVFDSFYRAGALVFGGGHVVLPLLEAEVVQSGRVSADAFLAGYGAAQAVPGPLFTFAAYLGAVLGGEPNGITGAALAQTALFLPGFLLLTGVLPFWQSLRNTTSVQSLMQGANAAVVGILGAALYSPVFTSAIHGMPDLALAVGCFVLLMVWKTPPWAVVMLAAFGGVLLNLAG
ncbi:chromate efflux transporter [Neptunicoccus cionae]|uniref:chromate efflux transporter n=1 Tax=Neptunicoccus cionae TaxID=2035344 RepID=UPI000C78C2F2|nr:chromate efflux transporter [Amylibacter cionae]PLS22637.1 chromate transporter [Amylibacter cionae]